MADSYIWLVVISVGVLTFALRWSFIALIDALEMPAAIQHALRFVPAAVLSAIILPAVVVQDGSISVSTDNLRLFAAAAAAVVAWRTRNIFYTIATGMLLLWTLEALRGAI